MGVVGWGEGCERPEIEEPSIGARECLSGEVGEVSSSVRCEGEGEDSKGGAPAAGSGPIQPVILAMGQQLLVVAAVIGGGAVGLYEVELALGSVLAVFERKDGVRGDGKALDGRGSHEVGLRQSDGDAIENCVVLLPAGQGDGRGLASGELKE